MVRGSDVSYWQDVDTTPQQIDFRQMKAAGANFTIIRAGQNLWPDPDFSYNWSNARIAGLLRGSYWYYDSRVSPEQQAQLWVNLIGTDKPEMEIFIDLEENFNGPYSGYNNWKKMIAKLEQLMPGQKIGIYTSYGYINGKIPTSEYAYFSKYILWLAYWTKDSNGNFAPIPEYVQIPKPWTQMVFWQWGTPVWGHAWGCESLEIDIDEFMGTMDQFTQRYGLPPTNGGGNGEIMTYVEITPNVAGDYRSIRNETAYPTVPHILGATSTTQRIFPNSYAKANPTDFYVYTADVYVSGVLRAKAGDKWWKVFEANGVPMIGWVADIHLGKPYINTRTVGDPVVPPPEIHETWDIKVMSDGSLVLSGTGGLTVNGTVVK